MELIEKLYKDPLTGLSSVDAIYRKAKALDKGISREQVKQFISKRYSAQLHKQLPRVKYYFPITGHEGDIQIDLMDVSNVSTMNKNIKFILVATDVFTRKGYVIPIKNKVKKSIIDSFTKLLKQVKPNKITCDNGSEFTSKEFIKLCKDNEIIINYVDINNHYIPHTGNRLGIVDRYIQKLRNKIHIYCDEYDTNKYIDVLEKLVNNINNDYNSGIKGVPNEVNPLQIEQIMTEKLIDAVTHQRKQFKVGDNVRCVVNKNVFEKGSVPKWSKKVHVIKDVRMHSFLLDNNKWYKYYQLQPIESVERSHIVKTRTKSKEPTFEDIKRDNRIKRHLRQEGIETKNIIEDGRKRNRLMTDKGLQNIAQLK